MGQKATPPVSEDSVSRLVEPCAALSRGRVQNACRPRVVLLRLFEHERKIPGFDPAHAGEAMGDA
jgi:hypothetical protein